jgi:hypothetical protein
MKNRGMAQSGAFVLSSALLGPLNLIQSSVDMLEMIESKDESLVFLIHSDK